MLDEYEPLVSLWRGMGMSTAPTDEIVYKIPNEVTDYYLQRVGFECEDVRLYVAPHYSIIW